jgi:hypothetical protein
MVGQMSAFGGGGSPADAADPAGYQFNVMVTQEFAFPGAYKL